MSSPGPSFPPTEPHHSLLAAIHTCLVNGLFVLSYKNGLFTHLSQEPTACLPNLYHLIRSRATTIKEKELFVSIKDVVADLGDGGLVLGEGKAEIREWISRLDGLFVGEKRARDAGECTLPIPTTPLPKFDTTLKFLHWMHNKLYQNLATTSYKSGFFTKPYTKLAIDPKSGSEVNTLYKPRVESHTPLVRTLNMLLGSEHTTSAEKAVFKEVKDLVAAMIKAYTPAPNASSNTSALKPAGGVDADGLVIPIEVIKSAWPALESLWEVFHKDNVLRNPRLYTRELYLQTHWPHGDNRVRETFVINRDGSATVYEGGDEEIPSGAPEWFVQERKAEQFAATARAFKNELLARAKAAIQKRDERNNNERQNSGSEQLSSEHKVGEQSATKHDDEDDQNDTEENEKEEQELQSSNDQERPPQEEVNGAVALLAILVAMESQKNEDNA